MSTYCNKNVPSSSCPHMKLGRLIIGRNLSTSLVLCSVILFYLLQSTHGDHFKDADNNVVLTLDLWENPQLIIKFSVSNNSTIYHIKPSLDSLKLNALISLSLTSMECGLKDTQSESGSAIKVSQNYGHWIWSCVNKTEVNDTILTGKFLVSDYNRFDLQVVGDWRNSRAILLATVYRKTDKNCECGKGFFCCSSGCPYPIKNDDDLTKIVEHTNHRCISQDLVCNGQVNCGFPCANQDENGDLCFPLLATQEQSSDSPCLADPQLCEPKDQSGIFIWLVITLGGSAALLFMGIFFFCLWYRRRTDWGIEKDTPYPRNPSVISLKEEGPGGTVLSKTRRLSIPESSRAPNPAAMAVMNIQRMSVPNDGIYSFEDV